MSARSRWVAVLRLALPYLRVLVRRARPRRVPVPRRVTRTADEHVVSIPFARADDVQVNGITTGRADVRHDLGTSTLEVWSRLDDESAAGPFGRTVLDLAREVGAHRLAWSLRPDSAEERAAKALGLELEGDVSEPLSQQGTPHQLWSTLLV